MPCLPGKTIIWKKKYRIKISRMSPNRIFVFLINPPRGNVRIQKLIAKHQGKGKTAKVNTLVLN